MNDEWWKIARNDLNDLMVTVHVSKQRSAASDLVCDLVINLSWSLPNRRSHWARSELALNVITIDKVVCDLLSQNNMNWTWINEPIEHGWMSESWLVRPTDWHLVHGRVDRSGLPGYQRGSQVTWRACVCKLHTVYITVLCVTVLLNQECKNSHMLFTSHIRFCIIIHILILGVLYFSIN